jgi:hypothetical protein
MNDYDPALPFKGMVIGAVDPILITVDTPLDPNQWDKGRPWFWPETADK